AQGRPNVTAKGSGCSENSAPDATLRRASLPPVLQFDRERFGSDRGGRQRWKSETSRGPVSFGAGYGMRGSVRTGSSWLDGPLHKVASIGRNSRSARVPTHHQKKLSTKAPSA